jgi:hypothetical protein
MPNVVMKPFWAKGKNSFLLSFNFFANVANFAEITHFTLIKTCFFPKKNSKQKVHKILKLHHHNKKKIDYQFKKTSSYA